MIAFACAQCARKLQAPDELAGRRTTCPSCKQSVTVPGMELTKAYLPAEAGEETLSKALPPVSDAAATVAAPASQPPLSPPALLVRWQKGERYTVDREIARGGMGAIFRATDQDIHREVAVKYLLDPMDNDKQLRFIEEAQITGQLEHPNIVPIHELGMDAQGRLFFTMKMVKGRSLQEILDALRNDPKQVERDWPLTRLLTVFASVCNALAYAHARDVIHRDLKPANLMVGDFGEVYVMDWGLAKVLGAVERPAASARGDKIASSRSADVDATQEGAVMGTPVYMSPEQAQGRIAAIDARSDVYSLGAILYEILTLQPPVDREGGYVAVLIRVKEGKILAPEHRTSGRAGKIPRELSAIAMKSLAANPAQRYPSATMLRRDIERFQEGRSVSAKDDTIGEMLWKFARRNKGFTLGAGMTLVVLLASVGLLARAWLDTKRAYGKYEGEQKAKEAALRDTVPAFVHAARLAINEGQLDDALTPIAVALTYDPEHAEARLLKAQLLIACHRYGEAREDLARYRAQKPDDRFAERLATLCEGASRDDVFRVLALTEAFEQQRLLRFADAMTADLAKTSVDARQKLLQRFRKRIATAWPGMEAQLTISNGKFSMKLDERADVADLTPLEGIPLDSLFISRCGPFRNLAPLKGMPLTRLDVRYCDQLSDLSALAGMKLRELRLWHCPRVEDIRALEGMPLRTLVSWGTRVREVSVVRGMPLDELTLSGPVKDIRILQGLPITKLNLAGCVLEGDLTPLRGMKLTQVVLPISTTDEDLRVLQGMPVHNLSLHNCLYVTDLSPLRNLPIEELYLHNAVKIRDLAPLEGMSLRQIHLPPNVDRGMDILRRMKSLERIEQSSATEFWKQYEAGKFPQYKS